MLPYSRASIDSHHSERWLLEHLRKEIEPVKPLRISSNHRYFQGTLDGKRFKIHRIVSQWNSLLPVIEGDIRGRRITFLFRPHRLVTGAYLCLLAFTVAGSVLAGRQSVHIILSFMSLSLLAVYVFYAEANEQVNHIRKLISG